MLGDPFDVTDTEIRHIANQFADQLREHFGISSPIEDMQDAVSRMGGNVSLDNNLQFGLDGAIRKISDSGFEIILRSDGHDRKKDRFMIAHLLGHLIFDMGFLVDKEKWDSVFIGSTAYF